MQPSDSRQVRKSALRTARDVYNFENKSEEWSYESVHWNVYESCIMEKSTAQKDIDLLSRWTKGEAEWRGLEKHCLPELADQQRQWSKAYVRSVVRGSKLGKKNNQYSKDFDDDEQEGVARAAREISRAARLYAEVMGKVDADAAAHEYINTQCLANSEEQDKILRRMMLLDHRDLRFL